MAKHDQRGLLGANRGYGLAVIWLHDDYLYNWPGKY